MEIWVPYGDVESLLTLQAENLGELVDPQPEGHADEIVRVLTDRLRGKEKLVVCDYKPSTLKILKALSQVVPSDGSTKIYSPFAKRIEEGVSELRGRVLKTSPPSVSLPDAADRSSASSESTNGEVRMATEAIVGSKLVLATGEPDPLYGYVDAKISFGLACATGTQRAGYTSREDDQTRFMQETKSYSAVASIVEAAQGVAFATIVTRGGEPYSVIDGGVKEAGGHVSSQQLPPAKGVVVGAGGRGYDDTLSHSVRMAMGAARAVRKGGELLIVAECRDGIGSQALEMQALGRISDASLRKGLYVEGMEEISYINQLKQEFSVTMLSSLPELYAGGRFRFKTARSSVEALRKILSSAGRNAKLHVLTRAPETLVG